MTAPITIRGVEYASQTVAAEAIGVSRQAISYAKRVGSLDDVGLGRRGPLTRLERDAAGRPPKKGVACELGGIGYPSIAEAARQRGVTYGAMVRAIALEQHRKKLKTVPITVPLAFLGWLDENRGEMPRGAFLVKVCEKWSEINE